MRISNTILSGVMILREDLGIMLMEEIKNLIFYKMSSNDVSILLNKLYKTKVSISELTEKHDKYRDMLAKIMSSKNTGKLDDGLYQISKRTFDRSSLGKKDVPHEIWDR